jgi:DNA-3-methyladenine glycosylase II|tara:strand:+ start:470 stop:1090 length:621 start_codon:yes stop_codon:yes gene_type:complete
MPATPGLLELVDQCEYMARAYAEAGAPLPRRRPDGFPAIVSSIIGQQVSAHAGAAIQRRVEAGLGTVSAEAVLAKTDDELRAFGLSRPKVKYIRGVAEAVTAGDLDFDSLRQAPDDEVLETLTRLKGIGQWTAEIYLMFALGRPDVMPSGDLALAESAARLMRLEARPKPKELAAIADRWRPWRSTAALMLWYYYRFTGGPGAPEV